MSKVGIKQWMTGNVDPSLNAYIIVVISDRYFGRSCDDASGVSLELNCIFEQFQNLDNVICVTFGEFNKEWGSNNSKLAKLCERFVYKLTSDSVELVTN